MADVGVNLLWCVPGDVGGSEAYLARQLRGLADAGTSWTPTLYAPKGFAAAHADLAARLPIVTAPFDARRRWRRIVGESGWLRRRARQPLLHHGGGTAPPGGRRPYVLTIHDLQYLAFPEHFSAAKRAWFRAVIPRSVRRAAAVAVPSEFVRSTVVEAYAVDGARVMVVPHGFEPELLDDIAPADELRARFGLGSGPLLVYPAMAAAHKNHAFLFRLLAERWRDPDLQLVLIGGRGPLSDELAAQPDGRVRHLGRVADRDRSGLLAMATAMVFPSRYEGFGAPLIEAMALGTPIVASDATCIPAVVGDAALVLPLDVDAWAGALDTVAARGAELVAAGRRRVGAFTAAASGRALAQVYARAMESQS